MPIINSAAGLQAAHLTGVDEDLARRILIRARAIAPGIRTVDASSEEAKDVLAILRAVAARASDIGSGAISSKSRNGTSISLRDIRSAFWPDDITGLRDIFATEGAPRAGLPIGSFPLARPLEHIWREGEYS